MELKHALSLAFVASAMVAGDKVEMGAPLHARRELGVLAVIRSQDGYSVLNRDGLTPIRSENVDQRIRDVSPEKLNRFIENGGYLAASQAADGQFMLRSQVRAQGGGPICAQAAYVAIKGSLTAALMAHIAEFPPAAINLAHDLAIIETLAMSAYCAIFPTWTP